MLRASSLRRAGPPREFDEVRAQWRGRVRNPGLRYAVTHPHKPWWRLPRLAASLYVSRWRAARQR